MGRFCAQCGTPADPAAPGGRSPGALWALAGSGLLVVAALVVMARRQPGPSTTEPPGPGATSVAVAPDLSGLAPRQQFDTLYNLVMRASEGGNPDQAAGYLPMALSAYRALERADADARYHLAVLHLHVQGDPAEALRLADSIQAEVPRHLFAYLIRGSAGQLTGDTVMRSAAEAEFLRAWDAELATGRPEYRDHSVMLDQFRERARQRRPGGKR